VTASAAAAAACHLHEIANIFFVEKMECRQADVSDFFFAQRDRL
jgi:hypothetical protein